MDTKDFSKKEHSVELLMSLRKKEELDQLISYIQVHLDNESNLVVIALCEKILNENNLKNAYQALRILCMLKSSNKSPLDHKAEQTINNYFKSSNIINSYKAYSIQLIWDTIENNEKLYIVDIIRKYRFHSLVNLVISVFEGDDLELIKEAIETLEELKESRGNRELRNVLRDHQDESIKVLAINALGMTGTAIDFLLYRKYINSSSFKLASTSISSTRKNLESWSIPVFKYYYPKCNTKLKEYIINELSLIKTPKSLNFLIDIMDSEPSRNLKNHVEWSIYNISTKKKITALITNYFKRNLTTRYYILSILGDFQDERCRNHFIEVITNTNSKTLKCLAINQLHSYTDKITVNFLRELIGNDDLHIRYTAIKSLINSSKMVSNTIYLELIEKKEELCENVLLTLLKYTNSNPLRRHSKLRDEFILYCFSHSNNNIKYAALKSFKVHHHQSQFNLLLNESKNSDDEIYTTLVNNTLIDILNFNPFYLTPKNIGSIDKNLFKNINIYSIKYLLVLHLIKIWEMTSDNQIDEFFEINIKALPSRLNQIFIDYNLEENDFNTYINFIFKKNLPLKGKTIELILKKNFIGLAPDLKYFILDRVLETKDISYLNFLTENLDFIQTSDNHHHAFSDFIGDVL